MCPALGSQDKKAIDNLSNCRRKEKNIKIAGMLEHTPTRGRQFHLAWRPEKAEGRRKSYREDRTRLPGRALLKIDGNMHKLEQWIF